MAKKKNQQAREDRRFEIDKDQALRSLDRAKIESFMRKYGIEIEPDPALFWADVHQTRLELKTFTPMEEFISRRWLQTYGRQVAEARAKRAMALAEALKERRAV